MREMTFGWPTEMMVKAARRGARIHEVPVSYLARTWGRSKVGGNLRGSMLAAYRILSVTLRYAAEWVCDSREQGQPAATDRCSLAPVERFFAS